MSLRQKEAAQCVDGSTGLLTSRPRPVLDFPGVAAPVAIMAPAGGPRQGGLHGRGCEDGAAAEAAARGQGAPTAEPQPASGAASLWLGV